MKKSKLTLVAVVLSGSLLFSSCVGSFGLFNRLSSWNQGVGNKFVNELVFLAFNIVPVYGVAYLADALVINSIEFWSGSNPMANVGDVKKVKGENGNYMVKTLENGYSITKEGETASMDLIYNKEANTWNVVANGESSELLKMNNDGTADLFLPNGEKMNVTLDAQGMMAARQGYYEQPDVCRSLKAYTIKQKGDETVQPVSSPFLLAMIDQKGYPTAKWKAKSRLNLGWIIG